jgi:hypothetical protein
MSDGLKMNLFVAIVASLCIIGFSYLFFSGILFLIDKTERLFYERPEKKTNEIYDDESANLTGVVKISLP